MNILFKFKLLALMMLIIGAHQLSVAGETIDNQSDKEIIRNYQNPLVLFTRLQVENNTQIGFGPDDKALNFLRFQPILPFKLNQKWNLVTRFVIPVVHQPWPEISNGLSDTAVQLFFTPEKTGKFFWGIGPSFLFPTATDETIGTEKWSAGPAAGMIYIDGNWLISAVFQNVISFAGDENRQDVNSMTIRPIITYTLPDGWYLTSSPSIVANWEADEGNRWLVPVGGGVGKVLKIGRQKMGVAVESYYHVISPDIGPDWQIRFQVTLLLPE